MSSDNTKTSASIEIPRSQSFCNVDPFLTERGPSTRQNPRPIHGHVYSAYKRCVKSGEHKTSSLGLHCSRKTKVRRIEYYLRCYLARHAFSPACIFDYCVGKHFALRRTRGFIPRHHNSTSKMRLMSSTRAQLVQKAYFVMSSPVRSGALIYFCRLSRNAGEALRVSRVSISRYDSTLSFNHNDAHPNQVSTALHICLRSERQPVCYCSTLVPVRSSLGLSLPHTTTSLRRDSSTILCARGC